MKISIVTATFNSGATLSDTLRSILAQTHTDFELIVADGGSTDNTADIVRQFAPQFGQRLRWFSEADRGLYDAMNKGIARATGDVIGILNSDDFYTDTHVLARVADALADPNIDACYGDVHYVAPADLHTMTRYYSSRPFRPWMMRLGFMPAHPSFYCRRTCYATHGTFDLSYRVAADFEQLLRLIFVHKIRTVYIPADFVTMRTGGVSTSGLKSHMAILRDHRRALQNHHVASALPLLLLRYVYKVGEVLCSRLQSSRSKRSK